MGATHVEQVFPVDVPAQKVMDTIRDPKLIEESELSRDALEVEVKDVEVAKTRHVYEIHTVNHVRSIKGIDKTRTEKNYNVITWELDKLKGSWVYHHKHDNIIVTGGYKLEPVGKDMCNLTMYVDLDVRVPIIGKTISKVVAGKFKEEWPKWVNRVRKHAKAL